MAQDDFVPYQQRLGMDVARQVSEGQAGVQQRELLKQQEARLKQQQLFNMLKEGYAPGEAPVPEQAPIAKPVDVDLGNVPHPKDLSEFLGSKAPAMPDKLPEYLQSPSAKMSAPRLIEPKSMPEQNIPNEIGPQAPVQQAPMGLESYLKPKVQSQFQIGEDMFHYTPERQMAMEQSAMRSDPRSPVSADARAIATRAIMASNPSIDEATASKLLQNKSADDLEKEDLLKAMITGGYGMQGAQAKAASYMGSRAPMIDVQVAKMAAGAADRIHSDPQIRNLEQQQFQAERGLELLNKPGLTNQEFNDVQIEISNAIAGAKNSALGKLERTEYETLGQKLSDIKQRITGKPQDSVPPEILARVKSLGLDLHKSILKHQGQYASKFMKSAAYSKFPQAQQELQQAVKGYQDKYKNLYGEEKPSSAPKVGEVHDGYVYIGGDPGNPKSWSKK